MTLDDWDDDLELGAEEIRYDYEPGEGGCPQCHAHFKGMRTEHCMLCHQTFSGSKTGDAHRVGPYTERSSDRRCLTTDELTGLGLWVETNQYNTDIWHGSPNKQGVQKRHPKYKETASDG